MSDLRSKPSEVQTNDQEETTARQNLPNLFTEEWQSSDDSRKHYRNARALVAGYGLPPECADEVYQDSIWTGQELIDQGEYTEQEDAELTTWLYEIAKNKTRNIRDIEKKHDDRCVSITDDDFEFMAYSQVTPEEQIEQQATKELIQDKIKTLSPKLRETVELYYLQGLNSTEIAEQCGEKPGTIRIRLKRAREILKHVIDLGSI